MLFFAGIDIGGTKTAIGVYDEKMQPVTDRRFATEASCGPSQLFDRIKSAIIEIENNCGLKISAAGVCTPGPISISEGKIVYIASIDWHDVPVVSRLSQDLNIPVSFDNDTNIAAYAERFLGAGKNLPAGKGNLIYITVSTGVGAGVIVDDNIVHGARDWAGEFGHIRLRPGGLLCSCGNDGCLEAYASGTAIAKATGISAIEAAALAKANDSHCIQVFNDMATVLGQGISILIQLYDPQVIALGGGLTHAWSLFEKILFQEIEKGVYKNSMQDISVTPTALGSDAGCLGAALLARKHFFDQ